MNSLREKINKLIQETYYGDDDGRITYDPSYEPGIVKEILSLIKDHLLEVGPKDGVPGKNLCDCPCKGPFCNSLMHQCDKPNEHYPQRDDAIIKIKNQNNTEWRECIEKELG